MQAPVSDKTFHLKWNNHLQNLSQLFTTIYSSSALADVTLSCRDGTLKAHKLVLSACSPYFEQIFKDNPCQHPIVILKGIPFSEINLLVEFMYKGSVDVQELDLQSLMHTASELEIRGLAYEARDNAAQMLNVNLEYPTYSAPVVVPTPQAYPQPSRTDVERLKQIHLYQQQMMRAEELRRRRRDEPTAHSAVNSILAAAAREMEEARSRNAATVGVVDETSVVEPKRDPDDERPKKRVSILTNDDDKLKVKKKPQMTVRFQDDVKSDDRPNKTQSPGAANDTMKCESKNEVEGKIAGIKVVQLSSLQKTDDNDHDTADDKGKPQAMDEDEETDSSGSVSDTTVNDQTDNRPHVCDVCDLRFSRASHLSRHRLTHTGERPFTCGGCGRSFARSDKLRLHTKICERVRIHAMRRQDDPTVDMASTNDTGTNKRENNSEVMSGMVRTSHRESGHLVFTPSGDVMLPPRTNPVILNSMLDNKEEGGDPPRRGRGRPRKTPLPLTPKIKKRRGRPPKTSLDGMDGCVLTGGAMLTGPQLSPMSVAAGQSLLLKRKRGRPPKTYFGHPDGRPNENYNATNLPFGDFSYLTDMMYSIQNMQQYTQYGNASNDDDRHMDTSETSHDRTIDLSDSSSEDEDNQAIEPEENVPPIGVETQIMTVGDCQIVKLPNNEDNPTDKVNDAVKMVTSASSTVTITPIASVGDCTIMPVENNT